MINNRITCIKYDGTIQYMDQEKSVFIKNKFKKIIIPEGVKNLICNNCDIKELIVPSTLILLNCNNNLIEDIKLNYGLCFFYGRNNPFNKLNIPDSVEVAALNEINCLSQEQFDKYLSSKNLRLYFY